MVGLYDVSRFKKIVQKKDKDGCQKKLIINVISDGITRLPILEGEISHIEIPRGNLSLGMTIVGGADTPLRCVVIQEIFPDGIVAQDGRLQPGDQIIEIDGVDMTAASHHQVCTALRSSNLILKLGIYRERIDSYKTSPYSLASTSSSSSSFSSDDLRRAERRIPIFSQSRRISEGLNEQYEHVVNYTHEEIVNIHLVKEKGRQLGIKLGQHPYQSGLYVIFLLKDSIASDQNQIEINDRILSINGEDMRYSSAETALRFLHRIKGNSFHFVIGRSSCISSNNDDISQDSLFGCEECSSSGFSSGVSDQNSECSVQEEEHNLRSNVYRNDELRHHLALAPLEEGENFINGQNEPNSPRPSCVESNLSDPFINGDEPTVLWNEGPVNFSDERINSACSNDNEIPSMFAVRKICQPLLKHKEVHIKKIANEGLGMRIGGGVNSNEGDTPIYIANINQKGPAGKAKKSKKGDILLSVNGQSLLGLTHTQAVSLMKSTAELAAVTLSLLEGPESSSGPANFIPSWMFWQCLPRALQLSKCVVLHRALGASLGFSIVGGSDPERGCEPIHVLFVVATSPAAVDGRLRCGDRILRVDGRSLEAVSHSQAVQMLKQAGQRVSLEVVSWMGTEI